MDEKITRIQALLRYAGEEPPLAVDFAQLEAAIVAILEEE